MRISDLLYDASWRDALADEWGKPYMRELESFLEQELSSDKQILPPQNQWLNALNTTPLEQIKVIIIGQDPYPTIGDAHGLCFSVLPRQKRLPKSLVNIYKELKDDLKIDNFHTGYLLPWAEQGVLMLNSVLTVEAGSTNSHKAKGWEQFTDAVIKAIDSKCQGTIFVLWGAYAQQKGKNIDSHKHYIISSAHPSPLSAYRGFWGSRPFSKINKLLQSSSRKPINWSL